MASKDMNVWNATGRIGTPPELRYTPSGQAVAEFRFAVGRLWRDAQGERREATTWISVICWGALAELVNQHMAKGDRVGVSGRLDLQEWEGREGGEKRSKVVCTASDVYFLEGRRAASAEVDDLAGRELPSDEQSLLAEEEVPF